MRLVSDRVGAYPWMVPRLWNDTIEEHRRVVRDAILDTTAELVAAHGLRAVTMSQIAERTGIGRATLYKYFPGVEEILIAWHERQIAGHLEQLEELASRPGRSGERLKAVLEAYALLTHAHGGGELAALVHRGSHVDRARERVSGLIASLVTAAAAAGDVRNDVAADELASYCLHALAAAGSLASTAAVRRLVTVTVAGLDPADEAANLGRPSRRLRPTQLEAN